MECLDVLLSSALNWHEPHREPPRRLADSLGIVAVVPALSQLEQMGDSGQLEGADATLNEFSAQLERSRQFINEYLKTHVPASAVAVS